MVVFSIVAYLRREVKRKRKVAANLKKQLRPVFFSVIVNIESKKELLL